MPVGSSAGCFSCKACAGRIICRLFLLQGLCRSFHLPAVFATRPVPVSFATGPFCYNGLVLPCHALPACLCHDPMPAALVAFAPFLPPVPYHVRQDHRASCRDCPVGSRNTGLHWRPVHRLFATSDRRACCRDCPVGSRITGLHWRPVHRFLFTALISKGEA